MKNDTTFANELFSTKRKLEMMTKIVMDVLREYFSDVSFSIDYYHDTSCLEIFVHANRDEIVSDRNLLDRLKSLGFYYIEFNIDVVRRTAVRLEK